MMKKEIQEADFETEIAEVGKQMLVGVLETRYYRPK